MMIAMSGMAAGHCRPAMARMLGRVLPAGAAGLVVWEDAQGRVFLTRGTGADIATRVFARHGITVPPGAQADTEKLLDGLARKATAE